MDPKKTWDSVTNEANNPGTCIRRRDAGRPEPIVEVGQAGKQAATTGPIRNGSCGQADDPRTDREERPTIQTIQKRIVRNVQRS